MNTTLLSPVTGEPLIPEGDALLRDADGRRWPVLDGIPYLRTGREALVDASVAALGRGERDGALALLLADQDDWWTGDKPDDTALRKLMRERDAFTLRGAMALLAYDRVGDYFAHRWSDPTYLAGLALLEAHWQPAATAFELACGIGHYGRDLVRRGLIFTGADVVFSKLWLARHWVVGSAARLVCFDAASHWPLPRDAFDLVFCNDAFYFLEPKSEILANLRARVAAGGRLCLSHIHNSGADNLSAGRAVSAAQISDLFPVATVYDDAELTVSAAEGRAARPSPLPELGRVEAFSVEDGPARAATVDAGLTMPPPDALLRLNPLYAERGGGASVQWPSPRYGTEYGPRATYPAELSGDDLNDLGCPPLSSPWAIPVMGETTSPAELAAPLVHAPARRTSRDGEGRRPDGSRLNDAVRRRVLVDLPERW